jgi:hypothetical protein
MLDRFWSRVDKGAGCWEWTGGKSDGYGQLCDEYGRKVRAHRYSYTIHHGPIPSGRVVRHTCDNPGCVNPSHLLLGTQLDNAADRDVRGRNGHSNKSHCPQGHGYVPTNTYVDPRGKRHCRTCRKESKRRARAT